MFELVLNSNNNKKIILYQKLKILWPLFMDGVQMYQGCRATTRRQFNFCH